MKHLLRFLMGGLAYFAVEVVWRILMQHGKASFLMVPMGGIVCVVVFLLYDKRVPLLLCSLAGAVTTTLLELAVGSVALFGFGRRFWHYGRINWHGIIALDWFFKWWGLCLGVVVAWRLLEIYLKKRRGKQDGADA
ncbi:MAG: hypothetical protein E7639_05965 [Ruminococcaceae bacterium]|nr:hypothetical protein [Oscillospiraceae bacterium]